MSILHDARSSAHWDPATRRFWLTVIAVGLIGGVAGAAYVETLRWVTRLLGPAHWARSTHLVLLGAVGAAIGILTLTLGNPGDVELLVDNIHVQGGASDLRALRALIPISLLGIGAGSAIGPEAPLVQTTGALGSWVGRRGRIPLPRSRWLTITGMGAGFTVLFGAPLGSAIFALEILHRDGLEYYEALLPAAVGSTIGYGVYATVTRLGLSPIWRFPYVRHLAPVDMVVGLGAGIVGAVIAFSFTYLSAMFRRGFRLLPVAVRPIAGGLALGGLAWLSPYALTFGESQIQSIVNGRLLVTTLIIAGIAKLLASSCIVSSGWRGGFIIPLFFMGAAFGAAGAHFTGVTPVVAMLSLMVAANVGVTKTPLGSCLIVVEMAGVRVLPPVLLAGLVAFFLTRQVDMIHTQRDREGAFEPGAAA
ncbi:MAG TPA: chloride channel protein [Actinomycetota bacterium]|nr:chloride channel protein [Actinomycetota bacterium]